MKRSALAFLVWCAGVACQVAPYRAQEGGYAVQWKTEDLPRICLMDSGPGNPHEAEVRATLLALLKQKEIPEDVVAPKLMSLPIYENDGRLIKRKFLEQITKAADGCDLVHLSWNLPHTESTIEIERALEGLGRERAVLVGAAGGPPLGLEKPLAESTLGQVSSALIVGERGADGLIYPSYTGPELLTALPAPAGKKGSSFSSLILTAEIAARWKTRTPEGWRGWVQSLREEMRIEHQRGNAGARLYRSAPELIGK